MNRTINGECLACESTYSIEFMHELVSNEFPEFCPFCGEQIEELSEEFNEDEDEENDNLEKDWD
jgi:hypothetical protein